MVTLSSLCSMKKLNIVRVWHGVDIYIRTRVLNRCYIHSYKLYVAECLLFIVKNAIFIFENRVNNSKIANGSKKYVVQGTSSNADRYIDSK